MYNEIITINENINTLAKEVHSKVKEIDGGHFYSYKKHSNLFKNFEAITCNPIDVDEDSDADILGLAEAYIWEVVEYCNSCRKMLVDTNGQQRELVIPLALINKVGDEVSEVIMRLNEMRRIRRKRSEMMADINLIHQDSRFAKLFYILLRNDINLYNVDRDEIEKLLDLQSHEVDEFEAVVTKVSDNEFDTCKLWGNEQYARYTEALLDRR